MHLTRQNLPEINSGIVELPGADYFSLPEKVLQFGTGVLLRGLPDYFIDKANKQGVFNGRIVVLKSTDAGELDSFARQDGLYTHKLQGITDGSETSETVLNACISRVLAAKNDWDEVLQLARSADLQLIVSNTTEVGIALVEDSIHNTPPVSFPGKLLAFLYERYRHFNGDPAAGLMIV
ncbi:MAG TPA: altronate oxidoreductase, partial [Chitinophagaceae bacterium]|nr:altronate oxidoreductase [Chitinophagaceae bacterium]